MSEWNCCPTFPLEIIYQTPTPAEASKVHNTSLVASVTFGKIPLKNCHTRTAQNPTDMDLAFMRSQLFPLSDIQFGWCTKTICCLTVSLNFKSTTNIKTFYFIFLFNWSQISRLGLEMSCVCLLLCFCFRIGALKNESLSLSTKFKRRRRLKKTIF